jgi:hypothetical protein
MRINQHYVIADAYKQYVERYSKKESGRRIWQPGMELTKLKFCQINKAYFAKLSERLLSGHNIKIPNLGYFCVIKHKCSYANKKVDFGYLKETGKIAYHTNLHSDGWFARFKWSKIGGVRNASLYKFKPTRRNARALSAIMQTKDGHKQFFT